MSATQALAAPKSLETRRLALRPPRTSDAARINALVNDWGVASKVSRIPYPCPMGNTLGFLDFLAQDTSGLPTYAVTLKEDLGRTPAEAVIGMIGFSRSFEDGAAPELGYWFGRLFWGKGFASEAARALVEMARASFPHTELHSGYLADNPASGRVLEKVGFRPVEVAVSIACLARGEEVPCRRMRLSLTQSE